MAERHFERVTPAYPRRKAAADSLRAVLFAVMHVYPIAMPYAFLFGLSMGWLRLRTGSTVNTLFIHVLNNLLFLSLGLSLLK